MASEKPEATPPTPDVAPQTQQPADEINAGHTIPDDVMAEIQNNVARYQPEPQFGTPERYGDYLMAKYIVSLYDTPAVQAAVAAESKSANTPVYNPQSTYIVAHQCVGTYVAGDVLDLKLDQEAMQRLLDLGAIVEDGSREYHRLVDAKVIPAKK